MGLRFKKVLCLLSMLSTLCFNVNAELGIIKYRSGMAGYGKREIINFVSTQLKNKNRNETKELLKDYFSKDFEIFICTDKNGKYNGKNFVGIVFEPIEDYDGNLEYMRFVLPGFREIFFQLLHDYKRSNS